jgi:trimethylamine--corrinoid protein Co-methyltransferase
VANAEMLAGLVIQQLHRPGAPFIHGPIVGPLDMKTLVNPYNNPKSVLAKVAEAQLARHYGLPAFGFGGSSDSKTFDQQAAGEAAMSLLVSAIAGANLIHDVGYLESGIQASPAMMTWCNEVIAQVRFMLKGVSVSDGDNLLDAIAEVGPGGSFLDHDSTLELYRTELWAGSPLTDTQVHDRWRDAGARDAGQRARQQTLELLNSHPSVALDKATSAAAWDIANEKA